MFISVLLGMIFSGVQDHPFGWPASGVQIISSALAAPGTNFVGGMSAMLNITYTLMYSSFYFFADLEWANHSAIVHRGNARSTRVS